MKTWLVLGHLSGWLRRYPHYAGLAVLAVLYGATFYLWKGLPIGGDILIPFNREFLERYAYSWNQWVDLGSGIPYVLAGPPLFDASIYALMETAGLSLLDSTWLYFTIMSFVGAASCCYLLRTVIPATKSSAMSGFVAGLVFLYNPLYIVDTYKSLFLGLAERATFPLAIALYANGLGRRDLRYSLAFSSASFILLGRFPVISTKYGLATIAAISILSVLTIVSSPKGEKRSGAGFSGKFAISTALLTLAVNAYWILPYFLESSTYNSTLSGFKLDFGFNSTSTLLNVFRLLGPWPFYAGYAPYSVSYYNPVIVASTFILPLLALSPLFLERSKRVGILAIIAAALVFLSKGTNVPFGSLYKDVVTTSVLKVFYISDIFQWFLLFAYCIMMGVAVYSVLRRLPTTPPKLSPRLKSVLVVTLMVGPLLIASWPLATGDVMTNYYDPSQKGVSIPNSYFQAADWLRAQNVQSRVFVAQNTESYSSTSWGLQGATQFYQLFFPTSVITGTGTQYSSSSTILRDAYAVFDRFSIQTPVYAYGNWSFRGLENSTWTNYQSDAINTVNDSFEFGPYINWQIHSNDSSIHEISKELPSVSDWTGFPLLVLALKGNFDPSSLAVGVGDTRAYVGFYYASDHVRTTVNGWQVLFLRLNAPDESTYDPSSVSSIWLRYYPRPFESAQIAIADIHLAYLSYDSTSWAKTLGLFSAKYVLTDSSLVQNKWSYHIQDNASAFSVTYETGPLTFHLNRYASEMLYGASQVSLLQPSEDPISLISRLSFLPNQSAFVTSPQAMAMMQNSSLTEPGLSLEFSSATFYRIHLISKGPFLLVLSQSFDPNWTACSDEGICFMHFGVNGYANGWYIDAPPGNYELTLQFRNQSSYSLSLAISTCSVLVLISTLVATAILRLKRRRVSET